LRDNTVGLKQHALKNDADALVVRAVLNQYELIAIGIRHEILDESMFRLFYRGTVLRDWNALADFIQMERHDNALYWIELEHLADRFKILQSIHKS